jgi:hypothetical protein
MDLCYSCCCGAPMAAEASCGTTDRCFGVVRTGSIMDISILYSEIGIKINFIYKNTFE